MAHRPTANPARRFAFEDDEEGSGDDAGIVKTLSEYSTSRTRRSSPSRPAPMIIEGSRDTNWMEKRKQQLREAAAPLASTYGSLTSMRAPGSELQDSNPSKRSHDPEPADEAKIRHSGLQHNRKRLSADRYRSPFRDDTPPAEKAGRTPPPESDDEAARRLLSMGGSTLHAATHPQRIIPLAEEDLVKADLLTRPDEPTLEDYAATPVSDFGAALLRGMGWKEGMGAGRKRNGPQHAPQVAKRADLLGLGAKERSSSSASQSRDRREPRAERRYVPVARVASDSKGRRERLETPANPLRREHRRSQSPSRGPTSHHPAPKDVSIAADRRDRRSRRHSSPEHGRHRKDDRSSHERRHLEDQRHREHSEQRTRNYTSRSRR